MILRNQRPFGAAVQDLTPLVNTQPRVLQTAEGRRSELKPTCHSGGDEVRALRVSPRLWLAFRVRSNTAVPAEAGSTELSTCGSYSTTIYAGGASIPLMGCGAAEVVGLDKVTELTKGDSGDCTFRYAESTCP